MARTTIVSATHTVRESGGKGLVFNATRIEIPTSGLRISVTADRSDQNWDVLNIQGRADDFRGIIKKAAQERKWRSYIPEVSQHAVTIGFYEPHAVDELISFTTEIGFTQDPPQSKRTPPKKKART